jgi:hypothetical protein
MGVLSLVAGRPGGQGSIDAPGAAARLAGPRYLTRGLYFTDGNAVRSLDEGTGATRTIAGVGMDVMVAPGFADGRGADARFHTPTGLDSSPLVYGNNTIRKVKVSTDEVTTLAGSPGQDGEVDGIGPAARFHQPDQVAYDGQGHLFVADTPEADTYLTTSIRKVDVVTGAVATVLTISGKELGHVAGLATDGSGIVYYCDSANSLIRSLDVATGELKTLAGSGVRLCESTDGTGTKASFCGPQGLATDGAGKLYTFDNGTVRSIDIETGLVTTLAGSPGELGAADGVGPAARFNRSYGLAYDGAGAIYVADTFSATLRRLDLATLTVSTLVGRAYEYGVLPGPISSARLNGPWAVAAGRGRGVFIADINENVILWAH